MSNLQRGSNSGITGLFALDGSDIKFYVRVYRTQMRLNGQTRARRGRGGGVFASYRWLLSAGSVTLTGSLPLNKAPAPDLWKGQTGTITFQLFAGKTITMPVIVTSHGYDFDEKKQDQPYIVASADLNGAPTYTGWASTPHATEPVKSNQEQWGEGTVKTYDKKGLLTSATRTTDIWGDFSDSDAAETQLLAGVVANALPPIIVNGQTLKLRTALFERNAIDGGIVLETWGLTDSADDILLPLNTRRDDPNKLQSNAHSAAINAAAPNPAVPHTVLLATDSKKLNDGSILNEAEYGPRNTKQEVEQDQTEAKIDKSGLASEGRDTKVFDTASSAPADATSPHASLKAVATTVQEITADQSTKTTYFDVAGTDEKKVFEQAKEEADPTSIRSLTIRAAVYTYGNTPTTPTVANKKLRLTTDKQLTSADTTNQYIRIWEFGETDAADDVVFQHKKTETDPNDLDTVQFYAEVHITGAPPPDPFPPTGLKLTLRTDLPLTDQTASNLSVRIWRWAKIDSKDARTLPKIEVFTDPNALTSESVNAAIDGIPSVLGGLIDRGSVRHAITPDHNLYERRGGIRTTIEDETFAATHKTFDKNDLMHTEMRTAQIVTTGTPLSVPTVPGNVKIISYTDIPKTSLEAGLTLRIYDWGKNDGIDELIYHKPWRTQANRTEIDPNNLRSVAIVTKVNDSAPTVPTGFKEWQTNILPVTNGLPLGDITVYERECRLIDTLDAIQLPGTKAILQLEDGERAISPAEQTTVLTCTASDTVDALAATARTSLDAGTKPWKSLSIVKEHDAKAVKRVEYFTNDMKFTVRARGGRWEDRPLDPGGTKVRLQEIYQIASTVYKVKIGRWPMFVTSETVVLRRYYKATTFGAGYYDGFRGTRNSGAFGDFPTGTCAFVSAEIAYNFLDSGTRWLAVDFVFERVLARVEGSGLVVDANWSTRGIPNGWYTIIGVVVGSYELFAVAINGDWVPRYLQSVSYSPFMA